MKADEREIRRKRRILDHALETGHVAKTCRYFGIPRSLFYLWRNTYQKHGQEGLRCGVLSITFPNRDNRHTETCGSITQSTDFEGKYDYERPRTVPDNSDTSARHASRAGSGRLDSPADFAM